MLGCNCKWCRQTRDALAAWDAAVRAYRPLDCDAYDLARDAWWACVGVEFVTPAMVAFGS